MKTFPLRNPSIRNLLSGLALMLAVVIAVPHRGQAEPITTVAGTGTMGWNGDGTAITAQLDDPTWVCLDAAGDVYIADNHNNRIRKVDVSTGAISTVAGTGAAGSGGDGGLATAAQLYGPASMTFDAAGNMYICDQLNNKIRKVAVGTGIITTIVGSGTAGSSGDGGAAISAALNWPSAVAVDSSGTLYIADHNNNRIRNVTGGSINTYAGNGTMGYSGDGGQAKAAMLSAVVGVCVDSSDNVYISDADNFRIRKVNRLTGVITTVAGNGGSAFNGDGIAATSAAIHYPAGVFVDPSGDLYIGAYLYNRVRRVDAATGLIYTVVGTGTAGDSPDGTQATLANIQYPDGLCVSPDGILYFAAQGNSKVRKTCILKTGSKVVKEQDPAAPGIGEAITYRIVVTNTGNATVTALTVVDTVSPVIMNVSTGEPSGFAAPTIASIVGLGTQYLWSRTGLAMAPGTVYTFTIAGSIGLVCGATPVSNTAYLIATSATGSTNMFTNKVGAVIQPPVTNISVTKTQTPVSPGVGDPVTYEIFVTNTGAATITNVILTDTVSPILVSQTTNQPAGWAGPTVVQTSGGTRYTWSRSGFSFLPGTTISFQIYGNVGPTCASGTVSNTAYVTASSACTSTKMFTNQTGFPVSGPVLSFTTALEQDPAAPQAGEAVTYRVIVTNTGGSTVASLSITDTISPTIINVTTDKPSAFGSPTTVSIAGTGTRYIWSAGGLDFQPGMTYTFTIAGTMGTVGAPTSVSNKAQAVAGNGCAAASSVSNATAFTFNPPPILGVTATKLLSPPAPAIGDTVTYRIVAANSGAKTITGLIVVDTVSSFIAGQGTAEPSGFAPPTIASIAGTGTRYVWSATGLSILPGATLTFTITGILREVSTSTPVANQALVTALDGSGAATGSSNTASFTALPIPPDLVIRQSLATPSPVSGGMVKYLVTVVNTGTKPITNLTVIDTLSPVIVNVVTAEPSGFDSPTIASIVGTGSRFVWTATGLNLLPGQSLTITITGTVGTVSSAATVDNHAGAGSTYSGGAIWSSITPVSFNLAPTGPILDQGKVRIVGGIRGYINPKRGEQATILLRPSGAGEIILRIFNLKGELVRIIRDTATSGDRVMVLHWDAKDDTGATVAPGAYPVLIEGPGIRYKDTLAVLR